MWTPDEFWKATPYEFSCAYVGYCQHNGMAPFDGSGDELEAFRDGVQRLKAKHPDRVLSKAEAKKLKEMGLGRRDH